MKFLWNTSVFCVLSVVYASSVKTKLTELLEKKIENYDADSINGTRCHLRETMAWDECGRYVNCPTSCTGTDDCAFPYCDSLGMCLCRKTFCRDDYMCHFFRIACDTKFTCTQGSCFCNNVTP